MAQRVIQEPLKLDYGSGAQFTLSGTSQQSSAFTGVGALFISTTADAYFIVGSSPTALADGSSALLPAGQSMVVRIAAGDKIAVLQAGSGGIFTATPVL